MKHIRGMNFTLRRPWMSFTFFSHSNDKEENGCTIHLKWCTLMAHWIELKPILLQPTLFYSINQCAYTHKHANKIWINNIMMINCKCMFYFYVPKSINIKVINWLIKWQKQLLCAKVHLFMVHDYERLH